MKRVTPPKTYLLKLPERLYDELWEVIQASEGKYPSFKSFVMSGIEKELKAHKAESA